MEAAFKKYKHEIILGILICIYIAYFTTASFFRYDNFYTGRFDLGNMDQTVWNTINGRIFQTSTNSGEVISRLSSHADFILILLSPFYFLWSHAKMLLLIQSVALGVGAVFVFLISKTILKNKNLSLVFGFLYLMNPALQYTNLYDFHPVTIATTTLLGSFYFLLKRKYFLMIAFLILSGITKEQVWIVTSFFGLPLLFQKSKAIKIFGFAITSISLGIFAFLILYAIPQSLGREHFALSYYSDYGNTPLEIVKNIIFSPNKLITTIFEKSRLDYLIQLLMPLGFLSFFSPITLMFGASDLLIGFLSNNPQLRQIYYQYSAAITPFIFISAIFGFKNINKWLPKIKMSYIIIYIIAATLFSAYSYGPLPWAKNPNTDMFTKPLKNKDIIENFLSKIPENYIVASSNNLGSHLSQRQKISTIPVGIDNADLILFLLNDKFAQPSLAAQREMVNNLKHDRNYVKVFEKDDFVVFKKREDLL